MSETLANLLDKSLIDMVYPVGSIYMSVNAADPAALFGGKWEQIKDRFLLAAGDAYAAGTTGGEATHTLTMEEVVQRDMWLSSQPYNSDVSISINSGTEYGASTLFRQNAAPHNNMPPYLTVYMWKRTA